MEICWSLKEFWFCWWEACHKNLPNGTKVETKKIDAVVSGLRLNSMIYHQRASSGTPEPCTHQRPKIKQLAPKQGGNENSETQTRKQESKRFMGEESIKSSAPDKKDFTA